MRVNESIWVRTHEDKEHPVTSGAYIEVFERSGSVGARMSFFDSDHLRGGGSEGDVDGQTTRRDAAGYLGSLDRVGVRVGAAS
jgi:hypothetical protein